MISGNLGFKFFKEFSELENIKFVLTDNKSEDIINLSIKKNIPFFKGNPRNKELDFIEKNRIDVLLSVNYLYIIQKDLINWPKMLAVNIHGSLLPKYRGRTPHVWAIINGESETGITAHVISEGCDEGDILAQEIVPISSNDTGQDMLLKFQSLYTNLAQKVLDDLRNNRLTRQPQNHLKATYFGKRTPNDGQINWSWHKERIRNWVRAQAFPYPGAFTYLNNQKLTIDKVSYDDYGYRQAIPNGQILTVTPLRVKTPNGVLKIDTHRGYLGELVPNQIFI